MDTDNANKKQRETQTPYRAMLNAMARHWNAGGSGDALAHQEYMSRYHFQRVFRGATGETPGRMKRRLILERAAAELRATKKEVTQIAFEANYRSLEGFGRAFKAAFGLTPALYRRNAKQISQLPAGSGVHFDPQSGGMHSTLPKGQRHMDLIDRLLESDYQSKRALFLRAKHLTDAQLDAPLAFRHNLMPFVEPAKTLRESLLWMVFSGWMDAVMQGQDFAPADETYRRENGTSPGEMLRRFESYHAAFRAFVQKIREENLWDTEWVDADCDPPHTFAIGAVIEATLTWDIAYRLMLHKQLDQFGFSESEEEFHLK